MCICIKVNVDMKRAKKEARIQSVAGNHRRIANSALDSMGFMNVNNNRMKVLHKAKNTDYKVIPLAARLRYHYPYAPSFKPASKKIYKWTGTDTI